MIWLEVNFVKKFNYYNKKSFTGKTLAIVLKWMLALTTRVKKDFIYIYIKYLYIFFEYTYIHILYIFELQLVCSYVPTI